MRNISPAVLEDARRLRELIAQMGRQRSLRDPMFATCEALQLTGPQFHALVWLGHDGPLRMGELSRRLGATEKTMTGVVDRLERMGQVQRRRDGNDRRIIRVRLTPRGRTTYRKLDGQVAQKFALLMALLDAADRQALIRIFRRLFARMAAASSSQASPRAASGAKHP